MDHDRASKPKKAKLIYYNYSLLTEFSIKILDMFQFTEYCTTDKLIMDANDLLEYVFNQNRWLRSNSDARVRCAICETTWKLGKVGNNFVMNETPNLYHMHPINISKFEVKTPLSHHVGKKGSKKSKQNIYLYIYFLLCNHR